MEGDAGASQLNTADADDSGPSAPEAGADQNGPEAGERGPSRLGCWLIGVCAVLVLAAVGMAGGGYWVLRSHRESQANARDNAAAVAAAKACVAATQAPDPDAMGAAERQIIEC
jgi:Mce-associated membrane protein